MPSICIVTTVDLSLDMLFPDFYPLARDQGYQITGICADTSNGKHCDNVQRQGVRVIKVPMTREFTPWQDLKCLIQLYRVFKKEKFDIIHYSTPKASLLSALAAWSIRDSFKLYTLRGLGYTAFKGPKRLIAKTCEKIACRLADKVIAISSSLATEAVREKLLTEKQVEVFGAGSSKGVNLDQFTKTSAVQEKTLQIRLSLGISKDNIIIGYAGRLTSEKGLCELYDAFKRVCGECGNVHLLLVGSPDQRNPLPDDLSKKLELDPTVHLTGHKDDIKTYMAAMDIFVLPSYREGFGNVLIEASAMEVPVIASDIPGCRDAVWNGHTGLLAQVQSSESLFSELRKMVFDSELRKNMGQSGRKWVEGKFDRTRVWKRLLSVYEQSLESAVECVK